MSGDDSLLLLSASALRLLIVLRGVSNTAQHHLCKVHTNNNINLVSTGVQPGTLPRHGSTVIVPQAMHPEHGADRDRICGDIWGKRVFIRSITSNNNWHLSVHCQRTKLPKAFTAVFAICLAASIPTHSCAIEYKGKKEH
ncbi:hypothetical protein GGI42DRAFT_250351 [Trichoderma sp. SZMC 28013]